MKTIIDKFDFLKKAVIIQSSIRGKKICYGLQLTVKIPDATNAKLNYQSYVKRKNTKLVGQSEITITNNYSTTVDIKSVTIEHPKTSHKLSKAIRQCEKKNPTQVLAKVLIALYIVKTS